MNPGDVDIERMVQETEISIFLIKEALSVPISIKCPATNRDQAEEEYFNAPEDSEEKRAALAKWREFSAAEIEEAVTLEETEEAYRNTLEDTEEERAAIRKLATFFVRS